jgi:hypothetical protein
MGVEVQDREPRVLLGEGAQDRVGDRMISTERDRRVALLEQRRGGRLDARVHVHAGRLAEIPASKMPPAPLRRRPLQELDDRRKRLRAA